MILAITAHRNAWDSPLDERFGRAQGFFLIDDVTLQTRYIDNSVNGDAEHGAGPASAQLLANLSVRTLLTGRVGPKAEDALNAANIQVIQTGTASTVKDAWELYLEQQPRTPQL
ncbi:NifB/NifX family molybdenum-iron cluster-binding protein [bacterium]|nr:NifB/NifX family molybdenum-iron cluster-binding protein [bacterium]